MLDREFKPNSHKYKEEQRAALAQQERKKPESVVTGKVRVKKKSGLSKMISNFITEDSSTIKSRVVSDVVIPTVKNVFFDIFEIILGGGRSRPKTGSPTRVSYRQYYDEPRSRDVIATSPRAVYDYDDVIIPNRGEADAALTQLCDILETYGMVSVADYYESVGINDYEYTANKYGWTNLSTTDIVRARDGGYMLRLPAARPLK